MMTLFHFVQFRHKYIFSENDPKFMDFRNCHEVSRIDCPSEPREVGAALRRGCISVSLPQGWQVNMFSHFRISSKDTIYSRKTSFVQMKYKNCGRYGLWDFFFNIGFITIISIDLLEDSRILFYN